MRKALEQFVFEQLLEEAEETERAARDAHRANVQAWFDSLTVQQQYELGAWMHGREWDTCQALSAAACDWHRSTSLTAEMIAARGAAVMQVRAVGLNGARMSDMGYSDEEVESAPFGHVRFVGTNVDVVTYRINNRDLCVLLNKDGVCVYRATLIGALEPSVRPFTAAHPLLEDTFVVRDLASARKAMEKTSSS